MTIVAQVNGKLRNRLELPADATEKEIEAAALADERVQRFVERKPIRKVIVVPKRNLINIGCLAIIQNSEAVRPVTSL